MLVEVLVGDGSLMYDYQFKRSIDSETYNKIKLYRDNKDIGKRDVFIGQDSNSIRKCTLQLYQSVDENMNQAQIREMLDKLMAIKNKETKTFKIKSIGDPRIRAGCYIPIAVSELGINQPFLVDSCTRKFDGSDHTMDLTLKVI